jgi:hypothetical protein
MFIVEDEIYSECGGEFITRKAAIVVLVALSKLSWNSPLNACQCMSWQTCGRDDALVEFNTAFNPWEELSRTLIFSISSKGICWHSTLPNI